MPILPKSYEPLTLCRRVCCRVWPRRSVGTDGGRRNRPLLGRIRCGVFGVDTEYGGGDGERQSGFGSAESVLLLLDGTEGDADGLTPRLPFRPLTVFEGISAMQSSGI